MKKCYFSLNWPPIWWASCWKNLKFYLICNSVRVNLSWQYSITTVSTIRFGSNCCHYQSFFLSQYDLTHILWLLSKSLVHWPNKESQAKRKRTPNDQREKHCRPGEYMYYISKQTSERRDHFHHHSQCNEVQHIVQLELDRSLVKLKKKVNRDWKFILMTF